MSRHSCVVPACTPLLRHSGSETSYHRFPTGTHRETWISRVQAARQDSTWQPKPTDEICSRHFESTFLSRTSPRPRLTRFAIPSLFLEGFPHAPLTPVTLSDKRKNRAEGFDTPPKLQKVTSTVARVLFDASCSPIALMPSLKVTTPTVDRIAREHSYASSPSAAIAEIARLRALLCNSRVEVIRLKKMLARRDDRLATVKEKLKTMKTLSADHLSSLQQQFPGLLGSLLANHHFKNSKKGKKGMEYSEEMKKFAVTLHYYSPRAYYFMRKHLCLPHPNTLGSWMDGSDCGPGFNLRVLSRLADARKNMKDPSIMTDVALMVDEIALHKELIWDPKQHSFVGHEDFGTGECEGDTPLASSALVCMIAGLKGGWKCPIGYVNTNKTDGVRLKAFLDQAFTLLEQHKFNVLSVTCDGCAPNVHALKSYGVVEDAVNPDVENGPVRFDDVVSGFKNPANDSKTVYAVYDVVHMMKLWRNMLAQCKDITWKSGTIDFSFIKKLHDLQEDEKILAANKLTKYHIDFEKHKMKVKYAVQALSRSVADALKFCRVDLKLKAFSGSQPTEDFLYVLDRFFDICNSRHPLQPCWKAPLTQKNLVKVAEFLTQFAKDILSMTYMEPKTVKKEKSWTKKLICRSIRKRAVIGSVVSMKSIIAVSIQLLYRDQNPLKFVMTYRLSQDLLELFFNKVRGRLGRNNNPNVAEFRRVMIHVWHSNWLKSTSTGNCLEILTENEVPGGLLPLTRYRKPEPELEVEELDLTGLTCPPRSKFYKNCLAYMAGFCIRSISKKLKCSECIGGLFDCQEDPLDKENRCLISAKQYVHFREPPTADSMRGLLTPCKSVFVVVEKADAAFRSIVDDSTCPVNVKNLDLKIGIAVLKDCLQQKMFPHLNSHSADFDPASEDGHLPILIKHIVSHYLKIRLFDYAKRYQKSQNVSNRHSLNKITLFRGQ